METKRCGLCKATKPIDEFGRNKTFADGHSTRCLACTRTYSREYYWKNRERIYTPVLPEEDLRRARYSQWAEGLSTDNIPKFGSERYALAKRIWRTSKVSLQWYETHSNFGCELCGNRDTPLLIDHDHSCCPGKSQCGKCARGVLCNSCNTRLAKVDSGTYSGDLTDAWFQRAHLYIQMGHQTLFHFLP